MYNFWNVEKGVESVVEVCWIFISCCCCFYLEEMRKEWLWSWSLVVVFVNNERVEDEREGK